MANTVQIVVSVDNAAAVAALGATTSALRSLGSTTSTLNTQWNGMQSGVVQTTQGMFRLGEAVQQTNGHMATSLDGVRLLSQEFGLKLPRALESIISRMPALSNAIGGALSGLAGFAVAEVLFRAGDAVYNLYNKYISLTAAANAYNKEVQKHKDEDFINAHSIETATQRINEATTAAKAFQGLGEEIRKGAWGDILSGDSARIAQGIGRLIISRQSVDQGYKSRAQSDAMAPKVLSQQHELTMMQIERDHAADGELRGQQKINAELAKRLAINKENQDYTRKQDAIMQGGALRSSGKQKQAIEDATARGEAAAQRVELERQVTQKTISLQSEARNAAMVGNQLLNAQRLEAEAEIRRSGVGTASQIDAIELKFHNDQMKRLKEEQDAVDKRAHTESESSLSTYAKIQAQGMDRIGDIDEKQKKGLYSDQQKPGDASALADKDRATATAAMYREMGDAQKKFEQEQQSGIDRETSEQLGAFGKIEADLQKSTQARSDAYTTMYGDMTQKGAFYDDARAKMQAGDDADTESAARQRAQVEQQIHDQTLQKDREAAQAEAKGRAEGLGSWQAKYHATINQIEAEHTAMIAKINAEASKPGVTASALADYQRQKVDADAIANAQIEDANQELAHSIAGTLESAFDTPIKQIQKKFEKMFFDIVAQWLAHSGMFGQSGSSPIGGGGGVGAPGGGGAVAGMMRSLGVGGMGGGSGAGATYAKSPVGQAMQKLGFSHPAAHSGSVTFPNTPTATTTNSGNSVPNGGASVGDSSQSQGSPSTGMYGFHGTGATSSPASAVTFPNSPTATTSNAGNSVPAGGAAAASVGGAAAAHASMPSSVGAPGAISAPSGTVSFPNPPTAATTNASNSVPAGGAPASSVGGGAASSAGGIAAARSSMTSSVSSFGSLANTAGSALNASGNNGTASSGLSSAGTLIGAGVGAYTGAKGMMASFESGNAGGILSGATSGAELGGSVGMLFGPEGAEIGAGIGAAAGLAVGALGDVTGEGGRLGGAKYFKTSMKPQMEAAESAYAKGSGTATSALSAIDGIVQSGMTTLFQKYGTDASVWVRDNYITTEQKFLSGEINRMGGAGKDYAATSAVQFHGGGTIRNFGDLATSGNEGFIHAMAGEKVTNPSASTTHGPYIDAMNAGASESDVAGMYLRNAGGAGGGGGDTHIHQYGDVHVSALDTSDFEDYLGNRGGMDAIAKMSNQRSTVYGGDSY